jgi:hypothetical protein
MEKSENKKIKIKNKNFDFFDFSENLRFCWFCDEKAAVPRRIIDQFRFQNQIWKVH